MTQAAMQHPIHPSSNGARLVATDGRTLPLVGVELVARAQGGMCTLTLEQRFANPYDEPLRLSYLVPLPEEAVVAGYRFELGGRVIVGRIEARAAARARFERAIVEGRSAALLEEERGSLFTQTLGNVPPRASITCRLTIDQPLRWLDEGVWEWRFPTTVGPRFLGEPGRTSDAARVTVEVADRPIAAAARLELAIDEATTMPPRSPSHALVATPRGAGWRVDLDAALDRDLVVRWPVARPSAGASLATARPSAGSPVGGSAYGLVTIVPPSPDRAMRPIARDLCILLDTSGSMHGAPLTQAQRVTAALVESLGDEDQLELIEFGERARRWKARSVAATAAHKHDALRWIAALSASGGTDMTAGILEALAALRPEAQRQVVLVTDGQIGFEAEVLRQILARLPRTSRLHTVGVGSAVNRALTRPAARAGAGTEIVLGVDEDPEAAVQRLLRRTSAPIVSELVVEGSALVAAAPERVGDLFAACPASISLALRPEGGELILRGRTAAGAYLERIAVAPTGAGAGDASLARRYARERVADRELARAAGGPEQEIDVEIEALGLGFQIATRLTSFVAVSDEVTVDPQAPGREEVMPHALPHGVSALGLGLRAAMAPSSGGAMSFAEVDDEREAELDGLAEEAAPVLTPKRLGTPSFAAASKPLPPPAAPRAPAAPKADGGRPFLGKLRSLLGGGKGGSSEGGGPRRLRGKVLSQSGREVIIVIEIDGPLELPVLEVFPRTRRAKHSDRVRWLHVRDRAGQAIAAQLDRARSTRPGPLTAGQVIRLVLDCAEDVELGELEIAGTLFGTDILVTLEAAP